MSARQHAALTRIAGSEIASVQLLPAGLSGQQPARVITDTGRELFVKWVPTTLDREHAAVSQISSAREAANLARAGHALPTARYVGFDDDVFVLVLEYLSGGPCTWASGEALAVAGRALDQVAAADTALAGGTRLREYFSTRSPRHCPVIDGVSTREAQSLTDCYAAVPELPETVLAHCEPHPDNWVVHGNQFHLVDFARLGLAPAGWDRVFLAAYLDLDAPTRAEWVLGGSTAPSGADAAVMAGAMVCRFAWGSVHVGLSARARRKQARMGYALPYGLALYRELVSGAA